MTATFVILAPIMTLAALGILFVRKAVHAALLLAVVMIGLAIIYASLDAPFLFAVQIVVYTGAILMLFLFVLMLVGVEVDDDVRETISGQRLLAWGGGVLLGVVLITVVSQASLGTMKGFAGAEPQGNVKALADLLFSRYVLGFEATSALLITAAIGAMVLAHKERLTPKAGQHEQARQRVRDFADFGRHLGPLPPPGTYATSNAVDTPALLPDGRTAPESVPALLGGSGLDTPPRSSGATRPATETDVGLDTPLRSSGATRPATETDSGLDTPPRSSGATRPATETDVGLDTPPRSSGATRPATETDSGLDTPLRSSGATRPATETDVGLDTPPRSSGATRPAAETDVAGRVASASERIETTDSPDQIGGDE